MRIFLSLARSRTVAAAARATGQDGSTVARRLKRLETALATTLFEHDPAGHVLTEAGRRLLAHAEAMEAGARQIEQETDEGAGLAGTIRVSMSEGFGTHIVAPRLARFAAAQPGIAIDLIASTGFLNPSRREADIAIMLARPRSGPLIAAKLTDYALGVYAADDFLERTGSIGDVGALLHRRLVGYVPDLIYAPELHYLAEVDKRLEPSLRSSSINAQAMLIASGAGCGILPCFIGERTPGLIRVLSDAVAIQRSFWLVVHRDMHRVARIKAFIEWLREEVKLAEGVLLGR